MTIEVEHDKPSLVWPHYRLVTGMPLGTDTSRLQSGAMHSVCS